jgi:undecaprenyl-diphosphatase
VRRARIAVRITGLAWEHTFGTLFAKAPVAAMFLTVNRLILLAGERLRRAAEHARRSRRPTAAPRGVRRRQRRSPRQRDDDQLGDRVTWSRRGRAPAAGHAGLLRGRPGRSVQTLALFAGISRSGVTIVAGVTGITGITGVTGVTAYLSVRLLTRYVTTRTLTPFAVYCPVACVACVIRFV